MQLKNVIVAEGSFMKLKNVGTRMRNVSRVIKKVKRRSSVVPTRKTNQRNSQKIRTQIIWKRQVRKKRKKEMGRNI